MNKSVVEVERFISEQVSLGKSDNTVRTYRRVLDKFAEWLADSGGDMSDLTRFDIQTYIKSLENEGKSASTIDKVFACLSVFARFLDRPTITENISRIRPTRSRNTAPKSLTDSETKRLRRDVEKSGNLRDIAIVYTLLYTGVRVSELCSLNRTDATIGERSGSLVVRGKGGKERTVPLSSEVRYHLTRYLETRTDDDVALFVSNYRRRISARAVQHLIAKYDTHPHALRHTYVRGLVAQGGDIATVAELAGHEDINVTRRYSKPSYSDLEKLVERAFS